jgi:hypothetical protein
MSRLLAGLGLCFGIAMIGVPPAAAQTADVARVETIIASPVPFSIQAPQDHCTPRDPMVQRAQPSPPSVPMPRASGDAGATSAPMPNPCGTQKSADRSKTTPVQITPVPLPRTQP